jgi:hypothetical protein
MSKGTHDYASDPRNEAIRISVNGELFARNEARVSVFDSGFVLGDGVWLVKRRPDKKAPRHESVGRVGLVEAVAAKLDGLGGALCSMVGSGRGIAGWSRPVAALGVCTCIHMNTQIF